jgi:hypothetical protein
VPLSKGSIVAAQPPEAEWPLLGTPLPAKAAYRADGAGLHVPSALPHPAAPSLNAPTDPSGFKCGLSRLRTFPVLPIGPPATLQAFRATRPRGASTVIPAASVPLTPGIPRSLMPGTVFPATSWRRTLVSSYRLPLFRIDSMTRVRVPVRKLGSPACNGKT